MIGQRCRSHPQISTSLPLHRRHHAAHQTTRKISMNSRMDSENQLSCNGFPGGCLGSRIWGGVRIMSPPRPRSGSGGRPFRSKGYGPSASRDTHKIFDEFVRVSFRILVDISALSYALNPHDVGPSKGGIRPRCRLAIIDCGSTGLPRFKRKEGAS